MTRWCWLLVLVVLCQVLMGCEGQTNLLVNGDMESCTSNQTASVLAGLGPVGWYPYLGRLDPALGFNAIGYFANTTFRGPGFASYSGFCSYQLGSESVILGITQQVAVTAGTQYVLSFFVMVADFDQGVLFNASYQWNTAATPTILMSQANFPTIPFWWTQFTFTITPPTGASAVNITFSAEDPDVFVQLDLVTLWPGSASAAPPPPPALTPNPSYNLLPNGDWESGSPAPWKSSSGDESGNAGISGYGAYVFIASAYEWGTPCPQGNNCLAQGAYTPWKGYVTISSLTCGYTYQLSFLYINNGGYSAANAADTGSNLIFSYGWGSAVTTTAWADTPNSTVAVGTTSNPVQVVANLGSASQTSLILQMTAYNYATNYLVDYIIVNRTGGSSTTCGPSPQPNAAYTGHYMTTAQWALIPLLAFALAFFMG